MAEVWKKILIEGSQEVYRRYSDNKNDKEFINEVRELAKKHNVDAFVITDRNSLLINPHENQLINDTANYYRKHKMNKMFK